MKADTHGSRGTEMRVKLPPQPVFPSVTIMIKQQQIANKPPPLTARFTDYFEVETLRDHYVVSFATARHIERCLDAAGTRDWIEFVDVFGERHSLPGLYVLRITEAGRGLGLGLGAGLSGLGPGPGLGLGLDI
jgi:hypothetical protein